MKTLKKSLSVMILTALILFGVSLADEDPVRALAAKPKTPIQSAIEMGQKDVVQALIAKGEKIDATTSYWGHTLLHVTAAQSARHPRTSLKIARLLIESGADVNAAMVSGLTPLHEAARSGTPAMARLLIRKGAKMNPRVNIENCLDPDYDLNNQTPTDVALASAQGKMIALLHKHGGKTGKELKSSPKQDRTSKAKAPDATSIIKNGRVAGSMPKGLVIRLIADLARTAPSDPKEKAGAEARGIDFDQTLKETWEFDSTHVHRVVIHYEEGNRVCRRVESKPFDSKHLCRELIEGKLIEIEKREGTGEYILFEGTDFDIGTRGIEVTYNERLVLEVGESCFFGGFPESDALAFGALYEKLAAQARASFEGVTAPPDK